MTLLLLVLISLFAGVGGWLLWTMHLRIENLAEKLSALATKVKDGEDVIIENFSTIEKRFTRVEHEIKEISSAELKAKEAIKTITKLQRTRSEQ